MAQQRLDTDLRDGVEGRLPLRTLSFCTGMGGDKAAYELAGIDCELIAVAEIDPLASAVLSQKFPHIRNLGDITNADTDWSVYHDEVDILTAGLPCQPHSIAGRRRGTRDSRDLTFAFCDIIETVQPEWILVENVEGYKTSQKGKAYRTLRKRLARAGYAIADRVIDARNFVPQRRRRLWILAHRGGTSTALEEILADAASGARSSDASGALRLPDSAGAAGGSFVHHPPRLGTLLASGSGLNRAGMKSTELSFLIVQEYPETGLIVRRPTPLEALRAQGFPDDWLDGARFEDRPLKDDEIYQLCGNAWPVPVAAAILAEIQNRRLFA